MLQIDSFQSLVPLKREIQTPHNPPNSLVPTTLDFVRDPKLKRERERERHLKPRQKFSQSQRLIQNLQQNVVQGNAANCLFSHTLISS